MYRLFYALSKDQPHFVGFVYTLIITTLQRQNAAIFITLAIELLLHAIEGIIIFKTKALIKKEL